MDPRVGPSQSGAMPLRVLRFTLLLGAFVPPFTTDAAATLDEVAVRVYDTTGLPAAMRTRALATADGTLEPTGALVAWHICSGSAAPSACSTVPQPRGLIVRILHAPPAAAGGANLARLHSSAGLPLGDAFLDVGQSVGVLATIYLDRVTRFAQDAGADPGTLLGYAIAHELGHLLMASNAHGSRGLMRSRWSSQELTRGRVMDWTFAGSEVAAIRRRLEAARIAAHVTRGAR